MITFDQAKAILNNFARNELRDHAFGDAEVYWMSGDEMIADGYYGSSGSHVGATDGSWRFEGKDADKLRTCGKLTRVERNDAGPQR
jgi:hypothetical protein